MARATLTDGVAVLEQSVGELASLSAEIRSSYESLGESLRKEIRDGDEETRRLMRLLHEDLVGRIKTIGEGNDGQRGV